MQQRCIAILLSVAIFSLCNAMEITTGVGKISSVGFPDNDRIFVGSNGGCEVYSTKGEWITSLCKDSVGKMAFSRDGKKCAFAAKAEIAMYDISSHQEIKEEWSKKMSCGLVQVAFGDN